MTNPAYRGSVIKIIPIALAFWLVSAGGAWPPRRSSSAIRR